jgi:hypothetical protein
MAHKLERPILGRSYTWRGPFWTAKSALERLNSNTREEGSNRTEAGIISCRLRDRRRFQSYLKNVVTMFKTNLTTEDQTKNTSLFVFGCEEYIRKGGDNNLRKMKEAFCGMKEEEEDRLGHGI